MGEHIFLYCERGNNPAFWAEPINALTNLAFILASLFAARHYFAQPKAQRDLFQVFLIVMVFTIGVGSFLFHVFADGLSQLADIVPIGIFMLAYLAFAMRRYLALNWFWVSAGLVVFVCACAGAMSVKCGAGGFGLPIGFGSVDLVPCFNGTMGYAPALLAMVIIGAIMLAKRHIAGRYLLAAGAVFMLSSAFRSIDRVICDQIGFGSYMLGTHFLWHIFNALTLYLLLKLALIYKESEKSDF